MNLNKDKANAVALPWKGAEVHSGGVCMDLAHGQMAWWGREEVHKRVCSSRPAREGICLDSGLAEDDNHHLTLKNKLAMKDFLKQRCQLLKV